MTTDFGTHPTVLVVVTMLLALVPADSACPSAGLKSGTCHLCFEGRLAGHYLAGGTTHVGTVEAELMQRASICTSPSPMQASAQAMKLCSQTKQAWMHSIKVLGSSAVPLRCVSSIRHVWLLKTFLLPVGTPD